MSGIMIACVIAATSTGRTYLILTALFIICAEKMEFDEIVKTSLIASSLTITFIVLSSIVGIIPNYTYHSSAGRAAMCLGFTYYSKVPYTVCFIFIMYMFLRAYKIKWIEIFILLIANFLLYRVTTVRLTFGIMLIAFALEILLIKFKLLDLNKKSIRLFSSIAYPLFFGVVIIITCLFIQGKPAWIYEINALLSNRLKWNARALTIYPITLFGQYIEMEGNSAIRVAQNYFYIDSGFFYSLMGYGIFFTIIFLLIYSYLYRYSVKSDNKPLFIWLTCVLVFTLINNTWVTITTNPVLLVFGCLIQSTREQNAVQTMHLQRKPDRVEYT